MSVAITSIFLGKKGVFITFPYISHPNPFTVYIRPPASTWSLIQGPIDSCQNKYRHVPSSTEPWTSSLHPSSLDMFSSKPCWLRHKSRQSLNHSTWQVWRPLSSYFYRLQLHHIILSSSIPVVRHLPSAIPPSFHNLFYNNHSNSRTCFLQPPLIPFDLRFGLNIHQVHLVDINSRSRDDLTDHQVTRLFKDFLVRVPHSAGI